MYKKLLVLASLAVLFILLPANDAAAQTARRSRTLRTANIVNQLPPSDAVININVGRLFAEGLPAAVAGDQTKLAQLNSQVEKLKTQTGVDPRAFDQLAMGLRYTYPSPGIVKVESVALARGRFNSASVLAAGRVAAAGRFAEQKYKGATVYVFTLNDQIRLFGVYNLRVNELAVAILNANTLAMGTPANVRAAIDAQTGRKINGEVAALALSDPGAIIAFGGNVPPQLLSGLRLDNDAVVKDLSGIRQVFGSAAMKGANFSLLIVARTYNAAQAKNLSDTVTSVLPLAPLLVGRLPEAKMKLAQTALANLKVVAQGNELRITTEVPQGGLAALIR
jgi:hypothetical protein